MFTLRKVVTVTNRNVVRFVDGVKILASNDLLSCSESFSQNILYKKSLIVQSLKKIILLTSIVDQLNLANCLYFFLHFFYWKDSKLIAALFFQELHQIVWSAINAFWIGLRSLSDFRLTSMLKTTEHSMLFSVHLEV